MNEGNASRKDLVIGLALFAAALAVRAAYLLGMGLPEFDPWRHLALIDHLRAGKGFTLFAGQPYVWYNPIWYRLCAALPKAIGPEVVAGFFSAASVGLLYLWVRLRHGMKPGARTEAVVAAGMAAVFGPMVALTCHYGPEALAVFAVLAALCLAEIRISVFAAAAAGLLAGFGSVTRLNMMWVLLVGFLVVRGRGRKLVFAGGAAVPVLLAWLRNHAAIGASSYLFTWDGIAARSSDFNIFSTLAIQAHPTVRAALAALHKLTVPTPEWLWSKEGVPWSSALFMLAGAAALVLWRKRSAGIVGLIALVSMAFLDPTKTGNYFRIYVGLFPLMLAAIAEASMRLAGIKGVRRRWVPWAMASAVVFCGMTFLVPGPMTPLKGLTPPPGYLKQGAYMVNSGLFHPESLCYAYPDVKFIGLPLRPEEFDDFHRAFPDYRFILWHDVNVQEDLARFLLETGRAAPVEAGTNLFGLHYDVWQLK